MGGRAAGGRPSAAPAECSRWCSGEGVGTVGVPPPPPPHLELSRMDADPACLPAPPLAYPPAPRLACTPDERADTGVTLLAGGGAGLPA